MRVLDVRLELVCLRDGFDTACSVHVPGGLPHSTI